MPQIIRHSYVKELFDPKLIKGLNEMLSKSDRFNIYLLSASLESECDRIEPVMMTKYSVEEFSEDLLQKIEWPNISKGKKIGLPPPNQLLPKNFDMIELDPEFSHQPKQISIWNDMDIWYK